MNNEDTQRADQIVAEIDAARTDLAGKASEERENRALDRLAMDAIGMSKLEEAMAKPSVKKEDHAAEPWPHLCDVPPNEDIPEANPHITECCGSVLMNQAHYERARACVNACFGMNDPAVEIARLREVNAALLKALKQVLDEDDGMACSKVVRAAIAKAEGGAQ